MVLDLPCGLMEEPEAWSGAPVYFKANNGRWYPVRYAESGQLYTYPSMALLGLPERAWRQIPMTTRVELMSFAHPRKP